jgi:hypothetical protein
MVERHGEFHIDCAPVYHDYGRALLRHYQKNSSVLGDVLNSDPEKKARAMGEDDDEDEQHQDGEQEGGGADPANSANSDDLALSYQVMETARVIYARAYRGPGAVAETRAADAENSSSTEGSSAPAADAAAAGPAASSSSASTSTFSSSSFPFTADAAAASTSSSSSSSSSSVPVDVASLSDAERALGVQLAYVYESLANWYMESEDFKSSISDFQRALTLLRVLVPRHHRSVAGLHMDVAVAALFAGEPEMGLQSYKDARDVIVWRCAFLEEQLLLQPSMTSVAAAGAAASSNESTNAPISASLSSSASASSSSSVDAPAIPDSAAAASAGAASTSTPSVAAARFPAAVQAELDECRELLVELKERVRAPHTALHCTACVAPSAHFPVARRSAHTRQHSYLHHHSPCFRSCVCVVLCCCCAAAVADV